MHKTILLLGVVCLLIGSLSAAVVDVVVEEQDAEPEGSTPISLLDINEDCLQPKQVGRCFALFYRFAFNVDSQKCEQFIYGGCGGNENNFKTIEECEEKCHGKLQAPTTPMSAAIQQERGPAESSPAEEQSYDDTSRVVEELIGAGSDSQSSDVKDNAELVQSTTAAPEQVTEKLE